MSDALVDTIARAVLYEGYVLYPYRPSVKTRQRWTFGSILPRGFVESNATGDASSMQCQCLLIGDGQTSLSIRCRFLHLTDRTIEAAPQFQRVELLRVADEEYRPWLEAVEREIVVDHLWLESLRAQPLRRSFAFDSVHEVETLQDAGRIVRHRQALQGVIDVSAEPVAENLWRLDVRVENVTPIEPRVAREDAVLRSFASTHFVLRATQGSFVSLTDPPAHLADRANECANTGCWPVLVGGLDQTDTLLVSPIILPDYPQIAPESPGDLFDGTEIDEILTLRILTLTDDEKRQAAAVDDRVRQMLQRTEQLARGQLANLHGAMRGQPEEILEEHPHA